MQKKNIKKKSKIKQKTAEPQKRIKSTLWLENFAYQLTWLLAGSELACSNAFERIKNRIEAVINILTGDIDKLFFRKYLYLTVKNCSLQTFNRLKIAKM